MNESQTIFGMLGKRELILLISFMALIFILGMILENILINQKYNNKLINIENMYNQSIQLYNFNLTAYSKNPTNENLRQPFACVLGEGTEMEKIYLNVFTPALNGEPKCFVNTH